MTLKIAFALAPLAAGGSMAQAATLEVGVGKRYSSISSAAAAANPYDTIIVYPGTYKGGSYINPAGPMVVRNNKFTNQRTSKTIFVSNRTKSPASLSASTLSGLITPLSGNGSVNGMIN